MRSLALLLLLACCLSGCGRSDSLTPERVSRVQTGMTLAQAEAILGPAHERPEPPPGFGEHALPGHAELVEESRTFIWNDGPRRVVLTVVDGKIVAIGLVGFEDPH
ncbi:MAG: hypothetical protein JJU33_04720 [Phycisphaerales bacterium]|nr:hypothetical protein [Phycisphaerales bacterium]